MALKLNGFVHFGIWSIYTQINPPKKEPRINFISIEIYGLWAISHSPIGFRISRSINR